MQKQKVKCIACEEEFEVDPDKDIGINQDGEEIYLTFTDEFCLAGEGQLICEPCKESDAYHLTTVVRYGLEGKDYVVKIGNYNAWVEKEDCWDTYGEELEEAYQIVKNRKWISTDPWRGYYSIDGVNHQFKVAVDGWVTGYPDRTVSYKEFTCRLYEYLQDNGAPFPVWWIFSPTSNVFSTAVDVVILKKNEKRFWKWIKEEFNQDREKVEFAFS